MRYVLGVDLGTSGTKTALFDEQGNLIADATAEYALLQPENGWAEQQPEDWWRATIQTISTVMKKGGIPAEQIAGLGFSGQMHGLVMLDAHGEVIRPAILWCDGRSGEECKQIMETLGAERLIKICGNPALTGFTASKILWVKRHESENYARCCKILLPKDYVRYRLTGSYAIDAGDASGTNLLDLRQRDWSDELLKALHIDRTLLPEVLESCDIAGTIHAQAAALTGLKEGTPVVCGSGDNASAAVGTGVVKEGLAFTTLGTSGVVYAHSRTPVVDPAGRIHAFCSAVPGEYAVMSCTLAAGLSLKWFKDTLCGEEMQTAQQEGRNVYALLDEMAAAVPAGANRLVYLPYLMGERSPILDEKARGVFFGLSAIHTKADMLRAVMEGVVYSQRQCFAIFSRLGIHPQTMLVCGGGGSSTLWRQMLADNYDCSILRPVNKEGPALGAALMAAVGVGIYPDLPAACEAVVKFKDALQPDIACKAAYDKTFSVFGALYPALKDTFKQLSQAG